MGTIGSEIKVGTRVIHWKLGEGIVLEVGKYGCIVDYTVGQNIKIRGSAFKDLEVLHG